MTEFNLSEALGDQNLADELRQAVLTGPQAANWQPTETELEQYMQGECHILAIALHRRLGWPIVALVDWDDEFSPGIPSVPHVMLEVPGEANLCIDINGWTSTIYLKNEVFFDLVEPESVWGMSETAIREWSGDSWDVPLYEIKDEYIEEADRVAERLIDSLGLRRFDRTREWKTAPTPA